jgi:hypothetical protein
VNRRLAIQRVSLLMGGTISAGTLMAIFGGCKESETKAPAQGILAASQEELMSEIAETIIPKTSTPGAKDAGVAAFIGVMLRDCYSSSQVEHFKLGLNKVEEESQKLGSSFAALTGDQKISVLKTMESLAKEEKEQIAKARIVDAESGIEKRDSDEEEEAATPFFQLMKELTLFGYFTSEVGCKEALAYDPIPKEYHGCIDLAPGQKAWAL